MFILPLSTTITTCQVINYVNLFWNGRNEISGKTKLVSAKKIGICTEENGTERILATECENEFDNRYY